MAGEVVFSVEVEDRVAAGRAYLASIPSEGPGTLILRSLWGGTVAGAAALLATLALDPAPDVPVAASAFAIATLFLFVIYLLVRLVRGASFDERKLGQVMPGRAGYRATFSWDDAGFYYSWDEGSVARVWRSLEYWRDTPELLLLHMSASNYLIVPKRALDPGRSADLARTLVGHGPERR